MIQSNLRSLHPVEDLDLHLDDQEDDDKLDVM